MHVAAYWPVVRGVHELEYKGVSCALVKTICMVIDIESEEDDDDMSMVAY